VVKRGGSIVIPAFAIGRTQTFMYYLRQLEDLAENPEGAVYVDSPMALSATDFVSEVQGRSRRAVHAGRTGWRRSTGRTHLSPGAKRGGIEGHQRCEDAMHHHFGKAAW